MSIQLFEYDLIPRMYYSLMLYRILFYFFTKEINTSLVALRYLADVHSTTYRFPSSHPLAYIHAGYILYSPPLMPFLLVATPSLLRYR